MNRSVEDFLSSKPLYYKEIDTTRMPRAYESIKYHLKLPKIIHIVGTNGKGTTGRFIATALYKAGYKTGHYTSPHILHFRERIWKDGENISKESLEKLHIRLLDILPSDLVHTLSYFEYTTFLAMLAFEECEYAVLEAGLGGEFDATAVFDSCLTVVTPIDKDHEAFLGTTIEQIATTKLKATKKVALLAKQPHVKVYEIAKQLSKQLGFTLAKVEDTLKQDTQELYRYGMQQGLNSHIAQNLLSAAAALRLLGVVYEYDYFAHAHLFGRMSRIADNIIVDVGHNPLAAEAIVQSLKPNKYVLVYNSYADKEYEKILRILAPIVKRLEIIVIEDDRIAKREKIAKSAQKLGLDVGEFVGVDRDEEYFVFGSFRVVESFVRGYDG